jgi:cyclic lactone autoinducer peptide
VNKVKKLFLQGIEATLTALSKKLVLTNCVWGCYRPEAPEELMKK